MPLFFSITRDRPWSLKSTSPITKRRAPQALAHLGKARGVFTCDAAFIGGFVQQRRIGIGVASDEDGRIARLHRFPVEHRHPVRIQLERGVLQAQAVHIGAAPRGDQRGVEAFGAFADVKRHVAPFHFVADAGGLQHAGIRVQIKLALEDLACIQAHLRIADAAQAAATAEDAPGHAQPRQRLAQFQTDHAGAENGDAPRQVVPGEDVVIHYQAIAQGPERRRHRRARTRGDDHAGGMHFGPRS
ncbi:hypothetical protein G6F65_018960 [Rhizopus arrhizus]|nr:hypothetical protein G6F65_018960 [Rhizopus arrhizus]